MTTMSWDCEHRLRMIQAPGGSVVTNTCGPWCPCAEVAGLVAVVVVVAPSADRALRGTAGGEGLGGWPRGALIWERLPGAVPLGFWCGATIG
ncbi:MAG TPA: hypothetical protein PLD23_11185 [Armatimonadota bacterium]|nr:hypothetical protein [Armatimonadota bacterium]